MATPSVMLVTNEPVISGVSSLTSVINTVSTAVTDSLAEDALKRICRHHRYSQTHLGEISTQNVVSVRQNRCSQRLLGFAHNRSRR